jgi:hypothetical protein
MFQSANSSFDEINRKMKKLLGGRASLNPYNTELAEQLLMGLESATFISGSSCNQSSWCNRPKAQGDDHIRLVKSVLQATFPNASAASTQHQQSLIGWLVLLGL